MFRKSPLMWSIKPKVNIKCCWCQSDSNLGGVWSDIDIKALMKILTHHLLSIPFQSHTSVQCPLGRGPKNYCITTRKISLLKMSTKTTTSTTLIQHRVFLDLKRTKSGRHLAPASFPSLKSQISKSFLSSFNTDHSPKGGKAVSTLLIGAIHQLY